MNTLITRPPRQAIAQPQGETRILVPNASWTLYESFVMKLPERSPIRTAFDGRDMEILVKGGGPRSLRRVTWPVRHGGGGPTWDSHQASRRDDLDTSRD